MGWNGIGRRRRVNWVVSLVSQQLATLTYLTSLQFKSRGRSSRGTVLRTRGGIIEEEKEP